MTEPSDTADSPMPPAAHERIAARVEAEAIAQVRSVFANAGIAAHVGDRGAWLSDAELAEYFQVRA